MELTAGNVYGFGQNPQASVVGAAPLSSYTGAVNTQVGSLSGHLQHPLFWLLILALILLGIFSFRIGFNVRRVGGANVNLR